VDKFGGGEEHGRHPTGRRIFGTNCDESLKDTSKNGRGDNQVGYC